MIMIIMISMIIKNCRSECDCYSFRHRALLFWISESETGNQFEAMEKQSS